MILDFLFAAALAAMTPPAADAPKSPTVMAAAEAPPIYQLGDDALRFRSAPALGGKAYIIQIHRLNDRSAEGEGVWLEGHSQLGWTRTGSTKIRLTAAQYDALSAEVDRALTPPPPRAPQAEDIVICTDGPGWFTERKQKDMVWTLSGFCGIDHPNKRIAATMQRLFPEHAF